MKTIRVVAGAVTRSGKLLIAQRSSSMSAPLLWELPGGKVEEQETEQQALKRELHEELSIDVDVQSYLMESTIMHKDRCIHMRVYACSIRDGEPIALEHARLQWIDAHEIHHFSWAPADVPLLDSLFLWLKGNSV